MSEVILIGPSRIGKSLVAAMLAAQAIKGIDVAVPRRQFDTVIIDELHQSPSSFPRVGKGERKRNRKDRWR